MAILADLLRGILTQEDQTAPQNRLAMIAGDAGTAGPIGSAQYQRALAQIMPQQAPQQPAQSNFMPSAPQGRGILANAPQAAPQPAAQQSGGGFGDFLGNLFDPQRGARNKTADYLRRQGLDDGTAALLAGNKGALQQYLLKRSQGVDPKDALQEEKLRLEIGNMRNPTTDDIREYNFARQQGYAKPFNDWMLEKSRAGATNISNNVDMKGDSAWATESAKLFAKRYDDITRQAGSASEMLGLYDLAQQGLDSGVRTGSLGSSEQAVRRFGQMLGIGDADKIAGGELLTAVQNRMALIMRSPDSGMGMPGAVSDRDLTFLKEAQVGLDRSPEGNRMMLNAFRALEKRKLDIARLADQYIMENGKLDVGFNRAVKEFADRNPLFADAAQESFPGAPPIGTIEDNHRYKGGNPADRNSWEPIQ